jgi:phosphoserine aminotransferase
MSRVFNFSAGPAVLPEEVLRQAAGEMLDWHGCGMGVMEMSHRGKEYMAIHAQALADVRELLAVPDNYKILFMQGGAIGENAIIPMNLIGRGAVADYVITGSWSKKSEAEARKYGRTHIAADTSASGFTGVPAASEWRLSDDAAYVFTCPNETVIGVEYPFEPDLRALGHDAPVVADMSSNILSRPVDVSKYGLIFAGAQKNIGPAGVTLVIVRDDLIGHALPICPSAFDYRTVAENDSMYNTPPTYSIYIAGLVFQWLKAQGGLAQIAKVNAAKAKALYACIDASGGAYQCRVEKSCRSRMNVVFFLRDERLNQEFLDGAKAAGMVGLKGHKSHGGMRASIYNAMPTAGVSALVEYMKDFASRHG